MSGSQQRRSVPEVARLLGISERGVRDKIERGQLNAVKEGKRWMVLLPPDASAQSATADAVAGGSVSGSGAVVDAVVTPAQIERAIERTGQKYVTDMAALYDRVSTEVGRLYEAQLTAKEQTIATQAEALAEMREQLRAERLRLGIAEANVERLERFYDPARWSEERRRAYHHEYEASRETNTDDRGGDDPPQGWWGRLLARLRGAEED